MNFVPRVFDGPTHVASREQQPLVSQFGLSKGVLKKPLSDVQVAVTTPFISDDSPRKSHHAHVVRLDFDFDQVHLIKYFVFFEVFTRARDLLIGL